MPILFSQLPYLSSGKILSSLQDSSIDQLITDSRQTVHVQGAVFFAIRGQNHDGHAYLEELYLRGIKHFVVEDATQALKVLPNSCNVFLAESAITSLQDVATYHRMQYNLTTIAITGSNGKTIVKEWLHQLLSLKLHAVKSPKSYNSQIGVPLSVWQIRSEHQIGIFEAGISRTGEMEKLERVIQPSIGIFTNIGPAHNEGFSSLRAKVEEKAKLFVDCDTIIYCKDHANIHDFMVAEFDSNKLATWSCKEDANYQFQVEEIQTTSVTVSVLVNGVKTQFHLPFADEASIENLLHCIVTCLVVGVEEETIQQGINSLTTVPMRLELKQGKNGSYIIDDTYNNDPEGLRIALDFMQQQPLKKNKILILSDIKDVGGVDEKIYKKVAEEVTERKIDLFVGVGNRIASQARLFPIHSLFFKNTEELLLHLPELKIDNSLILIKGARVFQFERVVQGLVQKIHRTVLEINLNALSNNLNVFRQMLKPDTKMMVMVKAFAYGSGSHEVAHLLQYHKVDYLAVAYTDEGVELRENFITTPIMVMNPTPEEFEKLLKYKLEPEIYSFRMLTTLLEFLKGRNASESSQIKIHLAIDTGMHRLGFESPEIEGLIQLLSTSKIKVASVFSHLVGIDEASLDDFSEKQAHAFTQIVGKIEKGLGYTVIKHLLNSAGITRFRKYELDMVRLGIGLYGIECIDHPEHKKLQAVGRLKTVVSQIRNVKAGDTIGYSRKGKVNKDSKVATLAIGYADGYNRAFGNGAGKVWINGKIAPIIGNVCMDMCMADVTDILVKEGDEVVIFGAELPVIQVAKWINTIPYEILTNVSERIKRIFYMD